MKFAICQEMFEDWAWEMQCRTISEIGYRGIEIAPFSLAESVFEISAADRIRYRRVAEDHGLEIIGLHWLLAKTEGLHLASPEKEVRLETVDYLAELGNLCSDLGGEILVFGSPQQRSLLSGVTKEKAMDYAAETLREVLPRLAERNVIFCLEPLTARETDFINTCEEAVELIDRIDHPNCRLHQDVKAMLGQEQDSIPELIRRFQNRLYHFHANDTNLLGPGMGVTDYEPIFRALEEIKYPGWVSVEVFDYKPGAERIAKKSFDYMQKTLSSAS